MLTKDDMPPVGERVLIEHDDIKVGAVYLLYKAPNWYFYLTDKGAQLAPEMVERWWKMPE